MAQGDSFKMLTAEFTSVGIKPEVSKTGSGHLRFAFEVDGKKDFAIASSTPSDIRSRLNERANIRRKLRAAGVYDRVRVQPLPLEKALEIPAGADPVGIRVSQLERDLGIVLELIHEIGEEAASVAYKRGWHDHGISVQKALGQLHEPITAEAATPVQPMQPIIVAKTTPPAKPKVRSAKDKVLANARYDKWMSAAEIAKEARMTAAHVSTTLSVLKKGKLVDNQDGKWRLRVQPLAANGYAKGHHAPAG